MIKCVILVTSKSSLGRVCEARFPGVGNTPQEAEKDAMHFINVRNTSPYMQSMRYTVVSKAFYDEDGNELTLNETTNAAASQ